MRIFVNILYFCAIQIHWSSVVVLMSRSNTVWMSTHMQLGWRSWSWELPVWWGEEAWWAELTWTVFSHQQVSRAWWSASQYDLQKKKWNSSCETSVISQQLPLHSTWAPVRYTHIATYTVHAFREFIDSNTSQIPAVITISLMIKDTGNTLIKMFQKSGGTPQRSPASSTDM